ncbi:MAG: hypothetical protein ACXIUZ_03490 [Lysobacteraceae bacterium]
MRTSSAIGLACGLVLGLAACTPDREGEMGRVDPQQVPEDGQPGVHTEAEPMDRQLREALAACEDVEPAVSREQCETEARRAYEIRQFGEGNDADTPR